MSTSLAEQLKKLAVPQTSLLIQGKTRPSLLFDPREAAKFDKDSIYEIGINLLLLSIIWKSGVILNSNILNIWGEQ
jgi:hypothetical protein